MPEQERVTEQQVPSSVDVHKMVLRYLDLGWTTPLSVICDALEELTERQHGLVKCARCGKALDTDCKCEPMPQEWIDDVLTDRSNMIVFEPRNVERQEHGLVPTAAQCASEADKPVPPEVLWAKPEKSAAVCYGLCPTDEPTPSPMHDLDCPLHADPEERFKACGKTLPASGLPCYREPHEGPCIEGRFKPCGHHPSWWRGEGFGPVDRGACLHPGCKRPNVVDGPGPNETSYVFDDPDLEP